MRLSYFRSMVALVGPLLLAAAITGCAQGKTPLDDAYALNGEYQAIAHAELGYLQSGLATDKTETAIKAADNIAYGYVKAVSKQAKAWAGAPDDQKPNEVTIFGRVMTLGRSALDHLSQILTVVRGDASIEGG